MNPENDTSGHWDVHFVGLTELFVAIFGAPMNAVVLLAACSRRKGMTLKSRRNITECLVISMSTADLIFSIFHSPIGFVYFYLGIPLNEWTCYFFYTTTHVSTIASSLSLLWLNVNKFLQLHRPLHYFLYMTKSRALIFIAIGWLISLAWGAFFVFGPFIKYSNGCTAILRYPELYIFFATEFFVLPTVVSLFVSVDIALLVLNEKQRRFRENFLRPSRPRQSRTPEIQNEEQPQLVPGRQRSKNGRDPGNVRRISFVFATTVWSAVTVLPYRIAYIINSLPGYKPTNFGMSLSFCLFALLALNAAGNPFITLLTHKQYSNQVYDWLRCSRRAPNESSKSNERTTAN